MLCDPTASVDVVNVAVSVGLLTVVVAMIVLPSLNFTVPSGLPPNWPATVAVNLTDWFLVDGFTDDVTTIVMLALFTVWVNVADLLVTSFPLPPYVAVMEFVPGGSRAYGNVAT